MYNGKYNVKDVSFKIHRRKVRMADLRDQFFEELSEKLNNAGIKAIIKKCDPINGRTIKLKGTALFKVLRVPNPFRRRGVAIYRKLSEDIIERLGGKRMRGNNPWVAAPLTDTNYIQMMEVLFGVAKRVNDVRNVRMGKVISSIEKEETYGKRRVRPKKRII